MKKLITLAFIMMIALGASATDYVVWSGAALGADEEQIPIPKWDSWYNCTLTTNEDATAVGGKSLRFEAADASSTSFSYGLCASAASEFDYNKLVTPEKDLVFYARSSSQTAGYKLRLTTADAVQDAAISFDRDGEWHQVRIHTADKYATVLEGWKTQTSAQNVFSILQDGATDGGAIDVADIRYTENVDRTNDPVWAAGKSYWGEVTGTFSYNGSDLPFDLIYSITTNADKTLTINATLSGVESVSGKVLKFSIESQTPDMLFKVMTDNGDGTYSYTTSSNTFELDQTLSCFFYLEYAGGAKRMPDGMIYYTTCSSNTPISASPVLSGYVSDITSSTATINYEVKLPTSLEGAEVKVYYNETELSASPYVLSGLAENTAYSGNLKAVATLSGEEYTSKEVALSFTTLKSSVTPTTISYSISSNGLLVGESSDITTAVLDESGDVIPNATATLTTESEGITLVGTKATAVSKGTAIIVASYEGLRQEIPLLVAADPAEYIVGMTATADNDPDGSLGEAMKALDGYDNRNDDSMTWHVLGEAEGAHEHWILFELPKSYNIDMIRASWEGACPRDYDVYAGNDPENLTKYYSITGHTQANWDDRFYGEEINDVKYIKVVTTYNATGWGIKMFEFYAYGTSNVQSVATSIELTVSEDNLMGGLENAYLSAVVKDQFGIEMANQEITYTVDAADGVADIIGTGDGRTMLRALSRGIATVKAHCGELSAQKDVTILTSTTDQIEISSATLAGVDAPAAIDGNLGSQCIFENYTDQMILDLGSSYNLQLITIYWETACPGDYTVQLGNSLDDLADQSAVFSVSGRDTSAANPIDKVVFKVTRSASDEGKYRYILINPTSSNNPNGWATKLFEVKAFKVFEDVDSSVSSQLSESSEVVNVYNASGMVVRRNVLRSAATEGLSKGLYIVGGRKIIVK